MEGLKAWYMGDAVAMALTRSWYKFRGAYKRLCHCVSTCRCLLAACVGGSTQLVVCDSVCLYVCGGGMIGARVCVCV